MNERQRPHVHTENGPDPWSDITGDGTEVLVAHGTYHERLPVAGLTVSQIRSLYGDRLDLAEQAEAIVGGHVVGDDHVVRGSETLVFAHRVGAKG